MNINLVDLPENVLLPGDEIAVFDTNLCVGAVTLLGYNSAAKTVSLPVSASDGKGILGFTEGNAIGLKVWKSGSDKEYPHEPEIIKGSSAFLKHESTF